MRKNTIKGASLAALAFAAALSSADPVKVTVNGDPVEFQAAQPQMIGGRVLVPLRGVFEAMGVTVDYNPDTRAVMADGNGHHVRLKIGAYDAEVDGRVVTMDVRPQIIDDSTMVPLRFLSQSLGANVDWRPEDDLVAIVARHDEGAAQVITPPPPPPPVINTPPPTVIIERPVETPAPPPPPPPPFVIDRDTVIPLRLDQALASNRNSAGDRVTATVLGDSGRLSRIPEGTELTGRVRESKQAGGYHGGTLEVVFTHMQFPDGSSYPIRGVVTRMNAPGIVRSDSGRMVAESGAPERFAKGEKEEGAPLILDPTRPTPTGGSALGGTTGKIVGVFHRLGHNVIVDRGTPLCLMLDESLSIDRHDLEHSGRG